LVNKNPIAMNTQATSKPSLTFGDHAKDNLIKKGSSWNMQKYIS
jgi:hypothetical protein